MIQLDFNSAVTASVAAIRHNDKCAELKLPASEYMTLYWGSSPGLGKSAMGHKAAFLTGRKCEVLIMAQYDPAELGGFVYRDGNVMRKARPAFLPEAPSDDVLFLDEFSQGSPSVQNVAGQLIYDRRIGEHELSPFSTVMLAGNLQTDKAGANPVVRQVLNRVSYMGMTMAADDWLTWGITHKAIYDGLHPTVIGFINFKKSEALHNYDPKAESNATPRSWHNVSKVAYLDVPKHVKRALIDGYVGQSASQWFSAFENAMDKLPDPLDIIRAPMSAPVPVDAQIIYATVTALCGHANDKTAGPIIQYLDRLERKEFCVFAIRYMHTKDKALLKNKDITNWMAKNAKLFV
jgi:hypothetical protein